MFFFVSVFYVVFLWCFALCSKTFFFVALSLLYQYMCFWWTKKVQFRRRRLFVCFFVSSSVWVSIRTRYILFCVALISNIVANQYFTRTGRVVQYQTAFSTYETVYGYFWTVISGNILSRLFYQQRSWFFVFKNIQISRREPFTMKNNVRHKKLFTNSFKSFHQKQSRNCSIPWSNYL